MAKELPYFKFEPAEYLTKDISFCSLSAQGLFINICSYYWQRNCELTKEQLLRRLNHETELNELIKEGVIDLVDNRLFIKFLDNQLNEVENKSKTNSTNGSKGGRPKKNPTESEIKPNLNPTESESISESKGIREDKIKEDEIKEDKEQNNVFFAEVLEFTFNDFWSLYPNKTGKKTAQQKFNKLTKEQKEKIEQHLPIFINYKPFKDYNHPHATTYLNQERYNDEININLNTYKNGTTKTTDTDEFRNIVSAIRNTGERL